MAFRNTGHRDMMTLEDLRRVVPEAVLAGDGQVRFSAVSTDSRTLAPGSLYFALRGPRFDGHDFVADAADRGAVAVVVDRPVPTPLPRLVVPNSRKALGLGAAAWRARFELPLIAVTGSNGKTTVTQMIAAILAAAYGEARRLATSGNLNNDIGVPLMLFGLKASHRAAVLELGMNHPGEIAYLAQLVKPTVAVVNNAQREHQEFMATVEATARENGSVIASLPADGAVVFPADDGSAGIWQALANGRRVLDFALTGPAAVTARSSLRPEGAWVALEAPTGSLELSLPVAGTHNLRNALAATTATLAIGIDLDTIRIGLESFRPVAGRGSVFRTTSGARVIDDTYNANPDSVRAAIDLLAQAPAPRILVLGDMGEVGEQGPAFHREVGVYASERGIETLLATGALSAQAVLAFGQLESGRARHFDDIATLIAAARSAALPESTLLAKGSRFMRMERVVEALMEGTQGFDRLTQPDC
jgi:UDP-N-acetylmuramoyl-tripeptide--D-alanyl-D-alanine ligase